MEALTTGTITLSSNGQSYTYDYEVPTAQKITVQTSWSNPSADIIGNINSYKDLMKAKGVNILSTNLPAYESAIKIHGILN